jgi:hypothetical protein
LFITIRPSQVLNRIIQKITVDVINVPFVLWIGYKAASNPDSMLLAFTFPVIPQSNHDISVPICDEFYAFVCYDIRHAVRKLGAQVVVREPGDEHLKIMTPATLFQNLFLEFLHFWNIFLVGRKLVGWKLDSSSQLNFLNNVQSSDLCASDAGCLG